MRSLHFITSRLQEIVESPTRHRARRSKRQQKSAKTSPSCTPFSPRLSFLDTTNYDRDTTPHLNASCSNAASMLSAVTTPTFLPSLSFPNRDHQSEAIPSLNAHESVSRRLDSSAEAFRLSENAVCKEAGVSIVQAAPIPEPPNSTERSGDATEANANYHEFQDSASVSKVEKDDHEVYLDNLRLLHFGEIIGPNTRIGDDILLDDWVEIDPRDYGWQE